MTPKTAQTPRKMVERHHAGNVETQPTLKTAGTKRTKQKTITMMLWDDLDRSTNRLRRKFDPTSNYLEAKVQMEQVMDSARRVNQVMTKGNYGAQAQRYWAALRQNINLARGYNLTLMET